MRRTQLPPYSDFQHTQTPKLTKFGICHFVLQESCTCSLVSLNMKDAFLEWFLQADLSFTIPISKPLFYLLASLESLYLLWGNFGECCCLRSGHVAELQNLTQPH